MARRRRLEEDEKIESLTLEQSRNLRRYLSRLNGDPQLLLRVTPERFTASGLDQAQLEREGLPVRIASDGNWVHIYGPGVRLTELLTMLREVAIPIDLDKVSPSAFTARLMNQKGEA